MLGGELGEEDVALGGGGYVELVGGVWIFGGAFGRVWWGESVDLVQDAGGGEGDDVAENDGGVGAGEGEGGGAAVGGEEDLLAVV